MDILGRKRIAGLQQELSAIKKEKDEQMGVLNKLSKELTEVKGFYSDNTNNEYLNELFKYISHQTKWVDFSSYSREALVATYETNAIVRGIVGTTIGNAVSELAKYVELVGSNDKVIEKHWVNDLLARPNDRFTKGKLFKAWAINRLLTGDAFIYAQKGIGSKLGEVKELYVINSQDVEIISQGSYKPIAAFKLRNSTKLFDSSLTPDNVMMSFEYNTKSGSMYGLSPLASAAKYLQIIESGLQRQNTSLVNGGVNNIITPKPDAVGSVTKVQADNVETSLNENRANYNKFVRAAIEVHKLGDTPADLSILDTSKYAINALCFVYGISVDSFLGQAKYENAREAKKAIYEQAAIPLINELLEDLTSFLKLKGERLVLNTDLIDILQDDPKTVMEIYSLAGLSLNEKREYLGFEKINEKYADQPMIPIGTSFGDPAMYDISDNDIDNV